MTAPQNDHSPDPDRSVSKSVPPVTAQVVSEALKRSSGEPSMSDEDFDKLVSGWVESIPPRTEPYTLQDLKKAVSQLKAGLFAIMYYIDKPFPDDARWTPYTRFIEPQIKQVDTIVIDLLTNSPEATNTAVRGAKEAP